MSTEERVRQKAATIATIILAGAGVVCLVAWSYFLYRDSWGGQKQGTSTMHPVLLYVLPAILGLLFMASLRLRPHQKINLTLCCLAVAGATYAAELFVLSSSTGRTGVLWAVDVATRTSEIVQLAKKAGVDFDTRTRLEIITELRRQGSDAVPAIFPRFLLKKQEDGRTTSEIVINGLEVLPLGGIASKVTVLCNETGEFTVYHSDERGFNNPQGSWNADRLEIAALGDSFTQGACVPVEKNFVHLLQARYPATLNLGMSSNGPLLMLAGIQEYLPAFKPATVLWFYFEGNDLQELATEAESRLLSRYLQGGFNQGLGHVQHDIDSHLTAWVHRETARELHREEVRRKRAHAASARSDAFLKLAKLTALRQRLGLIDAKKPAHEPVPAELEQRNLDLFVKVLSVADAMVRAWGGRLYFVYLPDWGRYGAPTSARLDRDPVLTAVTNLGIPVIDMHLAFKDHQDPLSLFPFRRFGHYNEEGHRLVADTVLRALRTGTNAR